MRQEYLTKLGGVQAEIERHVATLRSRKEAQQSAINRLQHEKRGLMETATKLSETFDDLTVNNQKLSSRLENILLKIQQKLPVRSDAELRMQRELLDVERKRIRPRSQFLNGLYTFILSRVLHGTKGLWWKSKTSKSELFLHLLWVQVVGCKCWCGGVGVGGVC